METPDTNRPRTAARPGALVLTLAGLCALPALVSSLGPGAPGAPPDVLGGSLRHAALEWASVWVAVCAAALAVAGHRARGGRTTAIIAILLLYSGVTDAVHAFVSTAGVGDPRPLSLTWTLSRLGAASILAAGIGLRMPGPGTAAGAPRNAGPMGRLPRVPPLPMRALLTCAGGAAMVLLVATSTDLPRTVFPGSPIPRPLDLVPGLLFGLAAVFVLRPLHRAEGSLLSHALVISVLPQVAACAYMAVGSAQDHDAAFDAAHAMVILAHLVLLAGLVLDYARVQRSEIGVRTRLDEEIRHRLEREAVISQQMEQLYRSNDELQQFAYVASHDLQEPLRKILTFGDRLVAKCGDALPEQGQAYLDRMQTAAKRMQGLINDLLAYSRVSSGASQPERVDVSEVVEGVLSDLELRIEQAGARVEVGELPEIHADPAQLRHLFQNLIGNAIKFQRPDVPPVVRIRSTMTSVLGGEGVAVSEVSRVFEICVEDNGIGFDDQHAERIFAIFQRLHSREEYEGTGVGLAIVRKIAERHGGSVSARGCPGEGSTFCVRLPESAACARPDGKPDPG